MELAGRSNPQVPRRGVRAASRRDGHEDTADQRCEHDGARHVLARVNGLFGEGGDGVEPEELVPPDGGTDRDRGEGGSVVDERLGADQAAGTLGGHHAADGQRREEQDDQRPERHQHVVGLVRHLDTRMFSTIVRGPNSPALPIGVPIQYCEHPVYET